VPNLDPVEIEDVILGCGLPEGPWSGVARVALLAAGPPARSAPRNATPSGLQAIATAHRSRRWRRRRDRRRHGIHHAVQNDRCVSGHGEPGNEREAAAHADGATAEIVAERYKVPREDQDAYALESQKRVALAQEKGWFDECIAPITVTRALKAKDGSVQIEEGVVVRKDECNRPDTTLEGLKRSSPRSSPTAASRRQRLRLSDGASATV
jgi:acetyl-CoA C-acetyltransferase